MIKAAINISGFSVHPTYLFFTGVGRESPCKVPLPGPTLGPIETMAECLDPAAPHCGREGDHQSHLLSPGDPPPAAGVTACLDLTPASWELTVKLFNILEDPGPVA